TVPVQVGAIMPTDDSDFFPIGDEGVVTIEGSGWGEGGFGEGPWGGGTTVILSGGETVWTEIETP
ncbi:MAG: hypothetical protein L0287_24905, partial [Anaerolineae bacterium]|nr:hypothetical protein [Anaerolineae bacterium]